MPRPVTEVRHRIYMICQESYICIPILTCMMILPYGRVSYVDTDLQDFRIHLPIFLARFSLSDTKNPELGIPYFGLLLFNRHQIYNFYKMGIYDSYWPASIQQTPIDIFSLLLFCNSRNSNTKEQYIS